MKWHASACVFRRVCVYLVAECVCVYLVAELREVRGLRGEDRAGAFLTSSLGKTEEGVETGAWTAQHPCTHTHTHTLTVQLYGIWKCDFLCL